MAFSHKTLIAKICSVVDRPGWYAAWLSGILVFSLFHILFSKHIVNIFLSMDRSMIGLRFSGGPLAFPGFCSGVKIPAISS